MSSDSEFSKGASDAALKEREAWLRDEVKSHRALLFSLLQWGMAIEAAVASALYFIRRDVAQALTHQQYVVPAQTIPLCRWLFGT